MKELIKDFKILVLIIGCSLLYSHVLTGKFDLIQTIDIILMMTFAMCMCSVIVAYNFDKKYLSNLYKSLSICFFGIGIASTSYIYIIKNGVLNVGIWHETNNFNLIFSLFESSLLIYCFKSFKTYFKCKKFFYTTLVLAFITVYLGVQYEWSMFIKIDTNYIVLIKSLIRVFCILLKIYLLKLVNDCKEEFTKYSFKNLKIFLYLRIILFLLGFINARGDNTIFVIISCNLIALGNYCIVKIIIVDIVRFPQETLYKDLLDNTKRLEETIEEIKEINKEKQHITNDFERKTREDEIKNEVLANISHEFKTPINVIYSAIQTQELINKNKVKSDMSQYNKVIKQNCNRLIRLVNNFIDITRFEKKNIVTNFKCTNIVDLTEEIVSSVNPFAKSKGIDLIFDTTDEELLSMVDQELYDRLILNVISNSIKYTNIKSDIKINMTDLDKYIGISIKDKGIGIEKDKLDIIFDRFERIDKSFSRDTEGSGLGLNIVKEIVELHNGEIQIRSLKGIGTEVIIKLPKYINSDNKKIEDGYNSKEFQNDYIKHAVEIEMADIYIK